MKRMWLLGLLLLVSGLGAPLQARGDLDRIVSAGNRAYQLSQRDRILAAAEALRSALQSGGVHGVDSLENAASMHKLYGNYYYELMGLDTTAFRRAQQAYRTADSLQQRGPVGLRFPLVLSEEFGQLYYRHGEYARALDYLTHALDYMAEEDLGSPRDTTQSECQDLLLEVALCEARLQRADSALKHADLALAHYPKRQPMAYARALRMHAKVLMLTARRPEEALAAYRAYFARQKGEAERHFTHMTASEREQYWLTLRPFIADCYRLEGADAAFLYDVTLFAKGLLLQLSRLSGDSPATRAAVKTLDYTWRDIQRRLKGTEAALEFVEYERGDTLRMAALLLRRTGRPQFIPLTDPAVIEARYGAELSSTDRRGKDGLYADSTLQSLVWPPALRSALSGVRTLYFAPDGYLHRLAIEYMPQVEAMDLCRLTSTRRLMEAADFDATGPMLFCGGINYYQAADEATGRPNDSVAYATYRRAQFSTLSAAADEAASIRALRHNPADTLLSDRLATEQAFRTLAGQYPSILVATHGDFKARPSAVLSDLKPTATDEAMSQSILALAGLNRTLADSAFDAAGRYDGLLSARELATLDLSHCRLFTISACQTALGTISSDGVFGLQRGLKNAGVGAMLLSLWNVQTEATARLMTEFYRRLDQGVPLRRAFREARQALSDEQPTALPVRYEFDPAVLADAPVRRFSTVYHEPQYLDAFILIDALE